MKRYIALRFIDRHAPGADITEAYAADELERWAKDGLVIIEEAPDPIAPIPESVEEAPTAETPAEETPKRKRK